LSGVRDSGEARPKHSSKLSTLYRVHIPGATLPMAVPTVDDLCAIPMIDCRGKLTILKEFRMPSKTILNDPLSHCPMSDSFFRITDESYKQGATSRILGTAIYPFMSYYEIGMFAYFRDSQTDRPFVQKLDVPQ
jgi:hypothetical protein